MMRKTVANSTFVEYRRACPFCEIGVWRHYCNHAIYRESNNRKGICTADCPRMQRWRRKHKNEN